MLPTASQTNILAEFGGFGAPERPGAVEVCDRDDCGRSKPLPTDLYCHDHGRFLPLISKTATYRVAMGVTLCCLVYASFELAAQLNSALPVYAVYAIAGVSLAVLPLRHYKNASAVAFLIAIAAMIIPLVFRATAARSHPEIAASLSISSVAVITLYTILMIDKNMVAGKYDRIRPSRSGESRAVSATAAAALVVATGCGVAGLWLLFDGYAWTRRETGIAEALVIAALAVTAATGFLVTCAGLIGAIDVLDSDVKGLAPPRNPTLVRWRAQVPSRRSYARRDVIDRIAGVFVTAAYRVLDASHIAIVAISRVATNAVLLAAYYLKRFIIKAINLLLKLVILVVRWLKESITITIRHLKHAISAAFDACIFTLISVTVPVTALGAAGWLDLASSDQTRRYLVSGSMAALALLSIFGAITVAAVTLTWVIASGQRLSDSLRSLGDSVTHQLAYGLLVLTVGGWLLGLPGTIGHWKIHLGWLTLGVTGVELMGAFTSARRRRAGPRKPSTAP